MTPPSDDRQVAVDHYENFPVASWLCPPGLRPPIAAIYWFARTADDLADEGVAPPAQRLADLADFRADLMAMYAGRPDSGRWPRVFGPLRRAVEDFALPSGLLEKLLDAFAQDVRQTGEGAVYNDREQLLAYCDRSANPIGRLLLHLHRVPDQASHARSDAVCSALQLINFWQDLGVDVARGRFYLPAADARRHGVDPRAPRWPEAAPLIRELCGWARMLMLSGAPLAHRIPGRAGWELRLVVQGGLRILDKIEALGCDTLRRRPKLRAADAPLLLWRGMRM